MRERAPRKHLGGGLGRASSRGMKRALRRHDIREHAANRCVSAWCREVCSAACRPRLPVAGLEWRGPLQVDRGPCQW